MTQRCAAGRVHGADGSTHSADPALPPDVVHSAVDWLVQLWSGDCTEEQRAQWLDWRAAHPLHQTGVHIKPSMARQGLGREMGRHLGVLVRRHIAQPQTFVRLIPRAVAAAVAEQIAPGGGVGMFLGDPTDDPRWIKKEPRVVV